MNTILLYHFSEKYYTQDPQKSCDFGRPSDEDVSTLGKIEVCESHASRVLQCWVKFS